MTETAPTADTPSRTDPVLPAATDSGAGATVEIK